MAIGNRWSPRARTRMAPLLAATSGTPPQPVVDISPDPVLEIRTESLISEPRTVTLPGLGSVPSTVATLEAPPHGQAYRIERYLVITANFAGLFGFVISAGPTPGDPATAVDASVPWTLPYAAVDEPNGIYLPGGTPLHFAWLGGSVSETVNIQYRVEEV